MKTKYITIEGGDGSGKSTLVKNLHQALLDKGYKVLLTKEFGSQHDPFCAELRNFAISNKWDTDEIAGQIVFGAIIRQHQEKVIKPSLGKYDIILSDRGPYSNYTYGPVHKIDPKFIKSFFDLIYKDAQEPTVSIFLNTPAELAHNRRVLREPEKFKDGGIDRIEAKGIEFQKQIIKNFLKIAKKDSKLKVINVNEKMTPEDILNQALKIIKVK